MHAATGATTVAIIAPIKGIANIKITRINPGAVFDVLVLTKNASLKEDDIIASYGPYPGRDN